LLEGEPVRGFSRVDARAEKAFARVNVAHADDAAAVHEEGLDRRAVPARQCMQPPGVETARERFDAKMREQWMRIRVAGGPEHRTEAPGVAQAQHAIAELQVEVVML